MNTYRLTVWRGELRKSFRYIVNAPSHFEAIAACKPLLQLSRYSVVQQWEQLTPEEVRQLGRNKK